jgi:hypothetical protein
MLAVDTTLWTDDVWVVDSTRSSAAARRKRCAAQTWQAGPSTATAPRIPGTSGVCVYTWSPPWAGCPSGFALTGAKADERRPMLGILAADPCLLRERPGQILIGDKNYFGAEFESILAAEGLGLLRPARTGEAERAGAHLFKPLRQAIEGRGPVPADVPMMPGIPERRTYDYLRHGITACSPRSTSPTAPSSANCTIATVRWSSRSS